jgi:glutaredoxin
MDDEDNLEQQVEPVDVEVEEPTDEVVEEQAEAEQEFYANLAENLDDRVLTSMAQQLISDYRKDKESRGDWEKAYTSGLDLLGFKYDGEGQPFRGASSVTHPLLAESVTQFQAQAYKELLPSDGPVKTMVVGDATPDKVEQAQRVKDFMNYMVTEVMEEYTPEFDQMLFYLPLAGSSFKKVYYDNLMQRAVSKFVPAEDLVVPYYASDLKDCERITHCVKMSENDLLKKISTGFYRDVKIYPTAADDNEVQDKYDELEGLSPTKDKEYQYNILEMHVDIDLEEYAVENSEKKIKVPYIVTIDEGSQEVLSIYRNYGPDDQLFQRKEYFVHYKFLPGLGFYGFGLIHMIGGLSRTATSALRQLLDAGTLANLPAGFKSRGLRIRDDDQPFQPGEFRDVDAPGGNIKDQFQILPFKEPSNVLMQLLGFVVQAGQRFASIADMQIGEDSQNRAVGTTLALMERGSRVMSAIHKRCYYSMRQEFRLLSNVFAEYLPPNYPYAVYGADRMVKALDFSPEVDVIPVADPNSFSMSQRVTLASQQLQIANAAPQLHNIREAYRRVYESLGTKKIDDLLLPEKKPEPMDPGAENSLALQGKPLKAFYFQNHDAHIAAHAAFIRSRMVQANPLVYSILQAHISEHISFKARAQVLVYIKTERPDLVELEQTDPQAYLAESESIVARTIAELTEQLVMAEQGTEKPDPVVMLKNRELDIKAMDMQRKAAEFQQQEQRKTGEFDDRIDLDRMKREDAEVASQERIRVADEKLELNAFKVGLEQAGKNEGS